MSKLRLRNLFKQPREKMVELPDLEPEADAASMIDISVKKNTKRLVSPRASDIYNGCMRKYILGRVHNLVFEETLPFSLQLTFAIGNALHAYLQSNPEIFGDSRYGHWRCLSCGAVTPMQFPTKLPCNRCGASHEALVYHEYEFVLKKPWLSGHIDMLTKREGGGIYPTEYKTIDGDAFSDLVAPLVSHIWQVNAYMIGLEGAGLKDVVTNTGFIIYFSKKNKTRTFPVKSFRVDRDEFVIEAIMEKLNQFQVGIKSKGKELPPRVSDCERNPACYKTKQCAAKPHCFKER